MRGMTPEERAAAVLREMRERAWVSDVICPMIAEQIRQAVAAARAAEREACAKTCDGIYRQYGEAARESHTPNSHERLKALASAAGECAFAIRARSQQENPCPTATPPSSPARK